MTAPILHGAAAICRAAVRGDECSCGSCSGNSPLDLQGRDKERDGTQGEEEEAGGREEGWRVSGGRGVGGDRVCGSIHHPGKLADKEWFCFPRENRNRKFRKEKSVDCSFFFSLKISVQTEVNDADETNSVCSATVLVELLKHRFF